MPTSTQPLTLAEARKVLLHAYFLSQGSYPLQELLFGYVHLLRPTWRLDDAMCQGLLRLVPSVRALVSNTELHGPLGDASVESSLEFEVAAMRTELGRAWVELDEAAWKEVHCTLIAEFIGRDYHYLCEESSRPRSAVSDASAQPRRDPYLSLYCHHVLLGHKIGCMVFDEMLANISATVQPDQSLRSLKPYFPLEDAYDLAVERLAAVVGVHNRWHLRSPVFFPSLE